FGAEGIVFTNSFFNCVIRTHVATSNGLTFSGTGNLDFNPGSGGNSYTGGTTLDSGQVIVGDNNALGSGALTLVGGTLAPPTFGSLTLANSVTLTNANAALGAFFSTLTLTGTVTLTGSNTLAVSNTVIVTGRVTGSGSLIKAEQFGGGNLVLAGSNDY